MSSRVVARVLESKDDGFKEGQIIVTKTQWRQITTCVAAECIEAFTDVPLEKNLSMQTGLAGWLPVMNLVDTKAGETAFVSAAAGATGSAAAQALLACGCKVFGSAGTQDKLDWLEQEGGLSGTFNYKEEDTADALARLCPNGVDIYVRALCIPSVCDITSPSHAARRLSLLSVRQRGWADVG